MKSSLVEPYAAEVDDFDKINRRAFSRSIVIVADDGANRLLGYDPSPDGDYAVIGREKGRLKIYDIRGDAVGCFLAR